jgi:hypothetical protein
MDCRAFRRYTCPMDLRIALAHLAEAEQHIALGERHIARQIEIIDMLGRGGHPTELATQVLKTYRELQITHLAHRDHIRNELEQ